MKPAPPPTTAHRQFLTFRAGGELFGMDIVHTREIIELTQLTPIPLMPEFLRGVINLRGEVVPVIDLGVRLERARLDCHRRSCIVVVEIPHEDQIQVLGLLVDAVSEVLELPESAVEPPPAFGATLRAEFIEGVARRNGGFVVLLDALHVLSLSQMAHLVSLEREGHAPPEPERQENAPR